MSSDSLAAYFEALDRLKNRTSQFVRVGTKITKDAVSLEAGRKKGSIKKSRPEFGMLIDAIAAAAVEQARPSQARAAKVQKVKQTAEELLSQLDAALSREMSLLAEIYRLRKRLSLLTGDTVIPIRANRSSEPSHKVATDR